jgi:crossover junction endodeoxyribonuclease RusA
VIEVVLPWPPKDLSPNARVHWSKRSKAAKAYRLECGWHVRAAGPKPKFAAAGAITLDIEFIEPNKSRNRDEDNLLASIKAGIDGIADALGVNDRRFVFRIRRSNLIGGMVRVRISEDMQLVTHADGVAQ